MVTKPIAMGIEEPAMNVAIQSHEKTNTAVDDGGDENMHLYAVNIDGSNEIDLTPFENVQARIIDDLEDDPNYIIRL